MYSTQSFCAISAFASNQPGVTSPIGELTTYAKTFTKELGQYHSSTLAGYDFLNFISEEDEVKVAVPPTIVNQGVALVDEAVRITLGSTGELFFDEILLALRTKGETIGATNINIGAMYESNGEWVPEWISWSDSATVGENTHRVWLTRSAFEAQYSNYEITVVAPIDDLDLFFNPGSIVETMIKGITFTHMIQRADDAKDGNPETILSSEAYEYNDPVSSSRRLDVNWTVLIYGPAGNDPDLIRDTLVDYILANSDRPREDWALIFPDIFKRTEFVFAPFWDSYALEQSVFNHGIYSPIQDHGRVVSWLTEQANGYMAGHIANVAQILAFPYRSLQIASVGHPENREGKTRISEHYPDYINVSSTDTDFGRMSIPTQEWLNIMVMLVKTAESLTPSVPVPPGYYRVVRGDKTYVAKSHKRVLLLCLAKNSIASSAPAPDPEV